MDVGRFDVKALTVGELDKLIELAEAEKESKQNEERGQLKEQWEKQASELGLSMWEVLGLRTGGRRTRAKPEPKYRSPSGETWSGRGRKPKWIAAALTSGKKLDDLAIKKTA